MLQHSETLINLKGNPLSYDVLHDIWRTSTGLGGRDDIVRQLSAKFREYTNADKANTLDRDAILTSTAAVWLAFARAINNNNKEGSDAERAAQQAAKEDA